MLYYMCILLGLVAAASASGGQFAGDSPQARGIFLLADVNQDKLLDRLELHLAFLYFDANNDTAVTSTEFFKVWAADNLGSQAGSINLFFNLDVNRDLQITEDIDMPVIFTYFDRDASQCISEGEFIIQWVKISS